MCTPGREKGRLGSVTHTGTVLWVLAATCMAKLRRGALGGELQGWTPKGVWVWAGW